ncbi:hypothetical protein [Janthinobacterium sp.]|uniref:hypothetical protein n=1 Tax=Janthinobacterium sp. TaxID=1871054 RepID=UPI002DB8A677|nr:hypothetical protein [Janthinobacterium sp.]HEU4815263.1 hypothetical protein [Janthinobacterium sp.]
MCKYFGRAGLSWDRRTMLFRWHNDFFCNQFCLRMRLHGFSIVKGLTKILLEEQELDLHNDYEFTQIDYRIAVRQLQLHWVRSNGDWVRPGMPPALTLVCEGVQVLKIRESGDGEHVNGDKCLSSIGFMWNAMRDDMDGVASHAPGEDCTDLSCVFMSDLSIKIAAAEARIVVGAGPANPAAAITTR